MTNTKTDTKTAKEKVNKPKDAIIAPSEVKTPASAEAQSHQYQENSPAINTNASAGHPTENIVEKLEKAAKAEKKAKAEEKEEDVISKTEYEARTKLDVSDVRYINPSLDHHKKGK